MHVFLSPNLFPSASATSQSSIALFLPIFSEGIRRARARRQLCDIIAEVPQADLLPAIVSEHGDAQRHIYNVNKDFLQAVARMCIEDILSR